jgi:5-methyltetrahydropteroyltriglutamate--homocysteine methyltransferase
MQRTKPPFRADEVGSLLRPPKIKEARARLEKGEISADELRKVEDMEIEKVVHKQASVGLKLATDGEFRRSWWHFDFLQLTSTGCELFAIPTWASSSRACTTRRRGHPRDRQAGFLPINHPMLAHFEVPEEVRCEQAGVVPKMTIPSPAVLHFRGGRKADLDGGLSRPWRTSIMDLAKDLWRKAVKAFYDAGCRYLQLDDTVWAYLCSQEELEKIACARRGSRPGWQETYARVINYAIAERPVRHGDHDACLPRQLPLDLDCVGRLRAGGGGDARPGTNYDGYFLEYDSASAPAGSSRCASCPRATRSWWSGVVTSKFGALETKDDDQAAAGGGGEVRSRYEQLALSPQCGFASTEEGNILTEDEQWAKLRLCRGGRRTRCGASRLAVS